MPSLRLQLLSLELLRLLTLSPLHSSSTTPVASFFDSLLSSSKNMDISRTSNHYSVVVFNSRGMLHLHALLWAKGNVEFANIRDRVLDDSAFAARMIAFLESTIVQSIDTTLGMPPLIPDRRHSTPSTRDSRPIVMLSEQKFKYIRLRIPSLDMLQTWP